ncbi:MAG: DUF3343 domain-containing protein [Oscillospiraceae bacterium]|jgi:hypothetical protein|nr:DUF3343 domain-containing protein [Oscillospiraceae bacterium]
MQQYLFICRSVTFAQKMSRLLGSRGITADYARAPKTLGLNGCAFMVRVSERNYEAAVAELTRARSMPGHIFFQSPGGGYVEVSN